MQMPNTELPQEKWAIVLDYEGMDPIKDSHRRAVTAVLLENQEQTLRKRDFLSEAPTNSVGNGGYTSAGGQTVAGFDPVLISLIRRAMPNLVAYDLAGVQPMSGPTGLIFAMRSKYKVRTEPKHCSAKQIPHSQVSLHLSTTPMDSPMVLLVWVLPHSVVLTLAPRRNRSSNW